MALKLTSIRENLIRRLSVNYVSYMGQGDTSDEWVEGYFQAKKDCEQFLKQLEVFDPESKS